MIINGTCLLSRVCFLVDNETRHHERGAPSSYEKGNSLQGNVNDIYCGGAGGTQHTFVIDLCSCRPTVIDWLNGCLWKDLASSFEQESPELGVQAQVQFRFLRKILVPADPARSEVPHDVSTVQVVSCASRPQLPSQVAPALFA